MAGDWIKMRAGLSTCPKVASMARSVASAEWCNGVPRSAVRLMVVGGLHLIWCAVNEHTSDGVWLNAGIDDLDDISGVPGIGAAMRDAGWLVVEESPKVLTFPNFEQWNVCGKDSSAGARMRKYRAKQHIPPAPVTVTRNAVTVTRNVTDSLRQRERERE